MDAQPYEGHGSTSPKKLEVLMMFVSFAFFFFQVAGCRLFRILGLVQKHWGNKSILGKLLDGWGSWGERSFIT